MARARRRSARPSGLDPLRVNRSHFARRSVAAACPHRAHRLERLEPYEGKLSRTVLRGGRVGDSPPPLDLWLAPISSPRKRASHGRWTNLRSDRSDVPRALISHFSFLLSRFQLLSLRSAPPVPAFSLSAFQLFASWSVEQRALGLLLPVCEVDQAPDEMGSP
jgi:hypothetical protein